MVKRVACVLVVVAACSDSNNNNNGTCGDGTLNPVFEQCDHGDMNGIPGDSCSATCTNVQPCGDGFLDQEAGEECDDGNTTNGDGCSSTCKIEAATTHNLDVGWTFETLAGDAQGCPDNFPKVVVSLVDSSMTTSKEVLQCNDGFDTLKLPPDEYSISVSIEDNAGTSTYATTAQPGSVDLTNGDDTYTANFITDAGYIGFTYSLVKASDNNATVLCNGSGIGTNGRIRLTAKSTTIMNPTAIVQTFECDDNPRYALTTALPADSYDIAIDVYNNTNTVIGTAMATTATVMMQNRVTSLNTVTIPIAGT
ncbi:MAG: DUF4215 domain-containing protein [Kofleriaceae bacterium]